MNAQSNVRNQIIIIMMMMLAMIVINDEDKIKMIGDRLLMLIIDNYDDSN